MYITADIGLDPFTGVVMAMKDKLKNESRQYEMLKSVINDKVDR